MNTLDLITISIGVLTFISGFILIKSWGNIKEQDYKKFVIIGVVLGGVFATITSIFINVFIINIDTKSIIASCILATLVVCAIGNLSTLNENYLKTKFTKQLITIGCSFIGVSTSWAISLIWNKEEVALLTDPMLILGASLIVGILLGFLWELLKRRK